MSYRDDVEALAARKDALDVELAARTRERDEAARMLDEARTRMRLPVLQNIRVASPCSVKWEDMTGDERSRLCAQCDKHVFNVSALTAAEAEALVLEKNGSLCVTYWQRKDGTILLADCEIGRRGVRRRRIIAAGIATAMAAGGVAVAAVHEREQDLEADLHERITGAEQIAGGMGPMPIGEPVPEWHPPARECYELRDAIFAVDECISAEMRAHFRGVFVDMLAQSQSHDEALRKQAVDRCSTGADALRGMAALCKP
jgi:hypothetical protein